MYFIDGRNIEEEAHLHFYDSTNFELLRIEEQLVSFKTSYVICRDRQKFACIRKSFPKPEPKIQFFVLDDMHAKGDLAAHEYSIFRNDECIATVSEKWFKDADSYAVEISDSEDNPVLLAIVAIIDLCLQDGKS